MLLELLGLYKWAICAGVIMGVVLAYIGTHLIARDRLMQSFCVSQGALLGTLLAIGLELFPTPVAFAVAGGVYLMSDRVFHRYFTIRGAVFGAIYVMLLSLSYMVSVIFPTLERHMADVFFGDLVTISTDESAILIMVGLLILFWLKRFWPNITDHSFSIALYGDKIGTLISHNNVRHAFKAISIIAIVLSVQWLGFLFTVACLYLPPVLGTINGQKGFSVMVRQNTIKVISSIVGGILLSLLFPMLPSVPAIVLLLMGLLMIRVK